MLIIFRFVESAFSWLHCQKFFQWTQCRTTVIKAALAYDRVFTCWRCPSVRLSVYPCVCQICWVVHCMAAPGGEWGLCVSSPMIHLYLYVYDLDEVVYFDVVSSQTGVHRQPRLLRMESHLHRYDSVYVLCLIGLCVAQLIVCCALREDSLLCWWNPATKAFSYYTQARKQTLPPSESGAVLHVSESLIVNIWVKLCIYLFLIFTV